MDPAAKSVDDADLRRFLRARDFDVGKAAKLIVQHLNWKRTFLPLGFVQESEISRELQRKQIFMQGHDKSGCSIVVLLTARHLAFERDLEEIKRLFVYTFDKAAASNLRGEGKFLIIGDLQGWGLRNMDIQGYMSVLSMLQNHYPERLKKLYLVHVPYLFWGAWKIIYPLVDKTTRQKILIFQGEIPQETLLEDIDRSQLPDIYGGQLELVPIQNSANPTYSPP